jgi:hypothetical protein
MSSISEALNSRNKPWISIAVLSGVILLAAALAVPSLHHSEFTVRTPTDATTPSAMDSRSHYLEQIASVDSSPVSVPGAGMIAAERKSAVPSTPRASNAPADRKFVRTGALELTVQSPPHAAQRIRLMAESMGGYLESAQIGGTKEVPTADLTIRVPANRFEDAKAQIRTLAARVESEKTDAQDVTRQYVDMEARLRNLRAEEAQYLTIMKSAYKVEDLLQVTEKLSEVRGQIEQQQAEFQTLSKQVETVAITISLRTLADAQVFGLNWRPLYHLKIAARDGLEAMADYANTMAAILFYVPVILAWSLTILLAAVAGWRLLRWTGNRFFIRLTSKPREVATSV